MKKKLLAILLSASMVVCLMPTMTFAAEDSATTEESTPEVENVVEESKEETQEETPAVTEEEEVVEEVKEEEPAENTTLSETSAESVEEAALEETEKQVLGTWNGYVYTSSNNEKIGGVVYYKENDNWKSEQIKIENTGVIDITEIVNSVFEKGNEVCNVVLGVSGPETTVTFAKIKANVSVDKATSKDTTFKYYIDSYLNLEINRSELKAKNERKTLTRADAVSGDGRSKESAELVKDSLILKSGETSASDYLVLRTGGVEYVHSDSVVMNRTIGYVIGEKGNDGNYTVSESLWAAVQKDELVKYADWNGFTFATFANSAELDSYIAELNATSTDEAMYKLLEEKFTGETCMSFSHTAIEEETVKSTKKGVQTGDSNELGLWLAMGMLASVAAAGYALKRREN